MDGASGGWEDRDLSPANPLRFNYRRIVGGARLLLAESEPWNLVRQRRVRELKADLVARVGDWTDVDPGPHRFGGTEFLVDGREIGHVHDFGLLDVPFVRPLGEAVVESGTASHHHVLPASGWVSTFVDDPGDLATAAALLELSYRWHRAKFLGVPPAVTVESVHELPLPDGIARTFERTLRDRT